MYCAIPWVEAYIRSLMYNVIDVHLIFISYPQASVTCHVFYSKWYKDSLVVFVSKWMPHKLPHHVTIDACKVALSHTVLCQCVKNSCNTSTSCFKGSSGRHWQDDTISFWQMEHFIICKWENFASLPESGFTTYLCDLYVFCLESVCTETDVHNDA